MNHVTFQTLESSAVIRGITREVWFVMKDDHVPFRRYIYKYSAGDNSVVAFKDYGVGIDTQLYVEEQFLNFFKNEPELEVILDDVGIYSFSTLKTFRME